MERAGWGFCVGELGAGGGRMRFQCRQGPKWGRTGWAVSGANCTAVWPQAPLLTPTPLSDSQSAPRKSPSLTVAKEIHGGSGPRSSPGRENQGPQASLPRDVQERPGQISWSPALWLNVFNLTVISIPRVSCLGLRPGGHSTSYALCSVFMCSSIQLLSYIN